MMLKSKTKKALSWICIFAIIFIFTNPNVSNTEMAFAYTSRTQEEAVSWVSSLAQNGTMVGSGQCVALIMEYYKYLGATPFTGNANQYATDACVPDGWERIPYTSGFVAQPGDIYVDGYGATGYGHVRIVINANSTSMTLVGQNETSPYTGGPCKFVNNCNYSKLTCVIRPDFNKTTINYSSIATGNYYLKNNSLGKYLSVESGIDSNKQNVIVSSFTGGNGMKINIANASIGYTFRPLCSSNRLINPFGYTVTSGLNVNIYNNENDSTQWWRFEKVSSGYVIRNVQNPSCVLDVDGSNVIVSTYSGKASQIWSLETADKDTEAPTISNIKISDVTEYGYTVSCTVNDNVGVTSVSFPSWNSDIHGGDNAVWIPAKISGNTASAQVDIRDLKSGEISGTYITHIYAYDKEGNTTSVSAGPVYIDPLAWKKTVSGNIENIGSSDIKITLVGNNFTLDAKELHISYEGDCEVKEAAFDEEFKKECVSTLINPYSSDNRVTLVYAGYDVNNYNGDIASVTFTNVKNGDKFTIMDSAGEVISILYANNIVDESAEPNISNINVSEIDEDGYTVSCKIDSENITAIKCLVWNSDIHTKDNAVSVPAKIYGNTAYAKIKLTDLESGAIDGNYKTQVIAYNSNGVEKIYEAPSVHITGNSIITPMPTETIEPQETIMVYELGDVDENGSIDAADALLVLKQAARLTELNNQQKVSADVTKDTSIDAADALLILKYAAKIIDNF